MPPIDKRKAGRFGFVAAGLATTLLLGVSLSAFAGQEAGQAPKGKRGTIARKYHNIKVLGDLPAEQLFPIMQEWNEALGVKCEFCHVQEKTDEGRTITNFEKETNPLKDVTREMHQLTMKLNANEKSVANMVTCFMCHRGSAVPAAKPQPPSEKPAAKPAPKPVTKPAGKQSKK